MDTIFEKKLSDELSEIAYELHSHESGNPAGTKYLTGLWWKNILGILILINDFVPKFF